MISTLLPVLAAPFVGSFVGVVISRLPAGQPIVLARSACGTCGHRLGARDLVPILSFLASRGACRHCGARIPPFHLQVELAAVVVALWACLVAPDATQAWLASLLGWSLLALAWIDRRALLLPDELTLPLLVGGLAVTGWQEGPDLFDHALAAAIGYGGFTLLAASYRRLRGWEGLGGGDAKLLAAGGAWLGTAALPWVVLVAAGAGLLAAWAAALAGGEIKATTRLAFGPWLALAIWLWRLHGHLMPVGG